jgi:hypothetical protein
MAIDNRNGNSPDLNLNPTTDEGFVNHPHMAVDRNADLGSDSSWYGDLFGTIRNIPQYGMGAFSSLNRSARANPWFSIAVIGLGAAALGYYFGRDRFARIGRDGSVITYTYEEDVDTNYDR